MAAHDDDGVIAAGLQLLLRAPTADTYEQLLTHGIRESLLIEHLETNRRIPELIDILAERGNREQMLSLITKSRSIKLFTEYTDVLVPVLGDNLPAYLWPLVHDFISHHAGLICSLRLQELFDALSLNGRQQVIPFLVSRIENEFPDRFKFDPVRLEIS